jgi:hypothetical protein
MHAALARTREIGQGIALWALAGFVLYVVGGLAMLFVSAWLAEVILESLGTQVQPGTLAWSIRNAFHPIVWGAFVAGASLPIGSRLVPGLRFGMGGWAVLATGLALATVTELLVAEFVRARYGLFDPEYAGVSFFASPALVAIALAGWAARAVPRRVMPLVTATILAVVGLGIALLPSVGGAADGIDAESIPIAGVFTANALYGVVIAALVIRARPSEPDAVADRR